MSQLSSEYTEIQCVIRPSSLAKDRHVKVCLRLCVGGSKDLGGWLDSLDVPGPQCSTSATAWWHGENPEWSRDSALEAVEAGGGGDASDRGVILCSGSC